MVTYKQWLLNDFAEGKTLASGVSLVEKCCFLPLIKFYNKACILVKNERRRDAKKEL